MKRSASLWAVLVAVAFSASAQGQPQASPAPRELSLDYCLSKALSSGADAAIAARNLDAARAAYALDASKNAFSLSLSGGYSLNDNLPSPSLTSSLASSLLSKAGSTYSSAEDLYHSIQAGLSLSRGAAASPSTKLSLSASQFLPEGLSALSFSLAQTLWDGYPGGQASASVAKSLLSLQGKELQSLQARSLIAANVKKAYVTALGAQRAYSLKVEIAKKQRSLLDQMRAVFALKQASSIDLKTAEINARGADLDIETAEHDLALARQRLANLVGLPPDSDFAVADTEDEALPAASLDEAVSLGLQKRAELALSDLSRRSSSIDAALARGQAQPNVSLTGALGTAFDSGVGAVAEADFASIGVKLSLPVLDGGAAAAQLASSSAYMGLYATQRRQLELSIAADIRDAYWLMTIQKEKVDLAKESQDLYEAQLLLTKTQNSYGTATNQDLLTAAVNAANAETAYLSAKSGYVLAVLSLETAMGL